ncbi:ATP-binding protein [Qipengyuania sp. DSG2-2]|uniref:sensor histidine kinase n=1 Tax=Qipengyuania sp. DGS2-2 TaxID=3349631 RepID=UPI0036D29217
MRLWPSSLRGQTLLAVALALVITQAFSAVLLYRAGETQRENDIINRAAISLLLEQDRPQERRGIRGDRGPRALATRRIERSRPAIITPKFAPQEGERIESGLGEQLGGILERQGQAFTQVVVLKRKAGDDPWLTAAAKGGARFARRSDWQGETILVAAIELPENAGWKVARVAVPPRERGRVVGLIVQTTLLFLVLMGVLFLLLRRITRPLAQLTGRTEQFAATQDAAEPLPATGPADVQRLITAHNAMEARIAALLDEKDVMLGAIGHDLKTPLTALRVRIEAVEDEGQRAKMAAGIEDITRSLDDILSLARIGRAPGAPENAQLNALASSVVEEFEDMGKDVSFAGAEKITAPVHVTWLRRALRNLVSNAVRYGGTAQVSLLSQDGAAILRVEDNGPGIPADQMADMLEPFRRGEASRNRATGGAGLGLTIARAIAQQHGGSLVLTNRESGGLRADILLPASGRNEI